jgi:hypothetical protein
MAGEESNEESRLFTLAEAEKTRAEVEPVLVEAIETRRKMSGSADKLRNLAERILRAGGILVPYEQAAQWRAEVDSYSQNLRGALERIQSTGCVVKDLDSGLLDFPARLNDEAIYYCWRLGEDRIRFYHRQDEGFAGRKPIDPRDKDYRPPTQ